MSETNPSNEQPGPTVWTAIYTRQHPAHAWKFDRVTQRGNAETAGEINLNFATDTLLIDQTTAKFAWPEFLDAESKGTLYTAQPAARCPEHEDFVLRPDGTCQCCEDAKVEDEAARTAELLEKAKAAQTAYWEALRELEEATRKDIDSTRDLQGLTVEDLEDQ